MSRTTSQCWHIIDTATGQPWNIDYDRDDCCPTEAAAMTGLAEALAYYEDGDPPPLDVVRRPHRCVVVRCDECDTPAEEDDGDLHFPPDAVEDWLCGDDWVLDGWRDLCRDCADAETTRPAGPGPADVPLPGLEVAR